MLVVTSAPAATLIAAVALVLAISGVLGCTAMAPQYAAQQYAPSYYEGGYSTLTPQQKFQLKIISPTRAIRRGIPPRR